jgi:hypothetical protein
MKFRRLKSSLPIYNQSPQFLQSDDREKPQGTFVMFYLVLPDRVCHVSFVRVQSRTV